MPGFSLTGLHKDSGAFNSFPSIHVVLEQIRSQIYDCFVACSP